MMSLTGEWAAGLQSWKSQGTPLGSTAFAKGDGDQHPRGVKIFFIFFWGGGPQKTKDVRKVLGLMFFFLKNVFFLEYELGWVLVIFKKNSSVFYLFLFIHSSTCLFTKNHFVGWLAEIIIAPWKLKVDTKHDGLYEVPPSQYGVILDIQKSMSDCRGVLDFWQILGHFLDLDGWSSSQLKQIQSKFAPCTPTDIFTPHRIWKRKTYSNLSNRNASWRKYDYRCEAPPLISSCQEKYTWQNSTKRSP